MDSHTHAYEEIRALLEYAHEQLIQLQGKLCDHMRPTYQGSITQPDYSLSNRRLSRSRTFIGSNGSKTPHTNA